MVGYSASMTTCWVCGIMLKHVQVSPVRSRTDSVSLRSSNLTSCASSMCGSPEPPNELQRTPSRCSSYSSLSDQAPQATIKVYTSCLKIDIEYKTLGIQWDTTSNEVIAQLLRRLKMKHRDPRLFYLSMEVALRRAGVKTILVLDGDTRPAILQACHPTGESRFCMQLKPGGLVRVHTSALQSSSQYKSLVISEETTSDELLQLLLRCYNSLEPVELFSIYEVCPGQEYQRKLHPDDLPLRAQAERTNRGETCHFLVRRNLTLARRRKLLANLNEAINNYDDVDVGVERLRKDKIYDSNGLLEMSIDCLGKDFHSLLTSDCSGEGECISTSDSSDTSSGCVMNERRKSCLKRGNFYKLGDSCASNSIVLSTASHRGSPPDQCGSVSPPACTYSPVYNIREIRTVSQSFSSLGKDKKLLDIQMNSCYHRTAVYSRLISIADTKKVVRLNVNTNSSSSSGTSPTAEAVNNNPAKGLGHFVYL